MNEVNESMNSYPLLFRVFSNYMTKLEAGEDDSVISGTNSVLPEENSEKVKILQHKLSQMQRKEAKTKSTLLSSQSKWANFSKDILAIAKKLMGVVDQSGVNQSINPVVYKSMKEKLEKFEQVIANILSEIEEN